jgi:hypothetical protein
MAQAEAVARVRVARIGRARATQELRDAIIAAVDIGASVTDVAAAAEVSRQRCYQILSER